VRATGIGLQLVIAKSAAFVATFTYLQKDRLVHDSDEVLLPYICGTRADQVYFSCRPRSVLGHSIIVAFLVLSLILSTTTMVYAKFENTKRARGDRIYTLAEGDAGMLGHRHSSFRYTC